MNDQSHQGTPAPLPHYVSSAPFDPYSVERTTAEQEKIYLASQWQLMRLKFKRHRIAVLSAWVLAIMYAAPQPVHVMHKGEFIGPFVYALGQKLDMKTLKCVYTAATEKPLKIRFF